MSAPLQRKEDLRHLTGAATFVEDVVLPNMLHAAILRSPYAHAKIKSIDVRGALQMGGVVATLTGEEIAQLSNPFPQMTLPPASEVKDYCMAVGKARYLGEPVAAVVAVDRYVAEDALEHIRVEYEPLPAAVDPQKAMENGAALVHENIGTNVMAYVSYDYGDVDAAFKKADRIVEAQLSYHRFSSTPVENYGVVASHDPKSGSLTVWCNNQMPMFFLPQLGRALNIPFDKLRIITPDIGGGFGVKILSYSYIVLLAFLSRKVGCPVKWIEDRREHLAASSHGAERIFRVQAAVKRDGTILGLKVRCIDDDGAYARHEPAGLTVWAQVSPGAYRFRNLRQEMYAVFTNKCPAGPNRGFSRAQHQFMLERVVDIIAQQLRLDPLEVRFKNYIRREEHPYETPNGCIYDGGDYPASLRQAMEMLDYSGWRRKQLELRREGRYIGIGFATALDSGANNFGQVQMLNPKLPLAGTSEAATLEITVDGKCVVKLGTAPQGQAHETTAAQVIAQELGVSPDDVVVRTGFDSLSHPYTLHSGTYASRFAVMGLGAAYGAARKLRDKIFKIAAHVLQEPEENLLLEAGEVRVKDKPEKTLSLRRIARYAYGNIVDLPDGVEPGLFALHVYRPSFKAPDEKKRGNLTVTYSYQTHGAVVEVDAETGKVEILKYVIVDDCGRIINSQVVEGQVHGAAAHGIGAALYEKFVYDGSGQLLTSTFMDYLTPTAVDVPHLEVRHMETPSLTAPLGAKGVGEGGGTPLPAIINAVENALSPFGIRLEDSHVSPEQLCALIKQSRSTAHS